MLDTITSRQLELVQTYPINIGTIGKEIHKYSVIKTIYYNTKTVYSDNRDLIIYRSSDLNFTAKNSAAEHTGATDI